MEVYSIHHQLYILRRENRLTQNDMATVLKITRNAYQNKESGRNVFTLPEAIVLANYFEVTLDELFNSKKAEENLDGGQIETEVPKHEIPPEVKAAMWQFFLKTSVPRLIAEHEEQKKKEVEDAENSSNRVESGRSGDKRTNQ